MTRICRAASRALRPYSRAGSWPICHGPSISLPRHQYAHVVRLLVAVRRRRSLHFVPFSTLQYSTYATAISAVPVPKLKPSSGSVPTSWHQSMNSLVPNWFVSIEFQARSSTVGPLCLRADAVEPVVAGDEIAAGIAHDRHAELLDLACTSVRKPFASASGDPGS